MDNMQANHQASIIEMDGKLCDQFVSLLIDPRSNYSYVNPDIVDKCGFNKEVHVESWLVQVDRPLVQSSQGYRKPHNIKVLALHMTQSSRIFSWA